MTVREMITKAREIGVKYFIISSIANRGVLERISNIESIEQSYYLGRYVKEYYIGPYNITSGSGFVIRTFENTIVVYI